MHRRILHVLEGQGDEAVSPQADILAYHAMHGQKWDKAVTYYRQAGDRAMARSAYPEAVRHYEQALAALEHLPSGPSTMEQAIDLRLGMLPALGPSGQFDLIRRYMQAAEPLAEALDDRPHLGRIFRSLTTTYRFLHDYDRALSYAQRAREMTIAHDDVRTQCQTLVYLGQLHFDLGNYAQAIQCFSEGLALPYGDLVYERRYGPNQASQCLVYMVKCLGEVGHLLKL
ncbi:MAG: tetratricopeptide repeat protein [bacterium]|nr:tetratricopeptide repeat protein [bacterium]